MCYYTDGAPCNSQCCHYPFFFLPHVGLINLNFSSLERSYSRNSAFTPVPHQKPLANLPEVDKEETIPAALPLVPAPSEHSQLLDLLCPTDLSYSLFLDPVDMLETPIFKGKVFKCSIFRLLFNLVDKDMQPVVCSDMLRFRLSAFTKNGDYQELECCERGTLYLALGVLRGVTIRDCVNSDLVVFDRLAFNIVSTKIPGHKVILMVHCMNSEEVKPFVIPEVVVRSRSRKTV